MTVHNDTVEQATQQSDIEQPYRDLGLKDDEYARIREILGRRPVSYTHLTLPTICSV